MKRPAFVGFSSEESEVAEQTPLEKRKLQVLLLLIQFVHCARLRSRLLIDSEQSSIYLEFCFCGLFPSIR
jgi:hypothetical protein